MNTFKQAATQCVLGAAIAIATMGAASAAPQTVGGVTWDPAYPLDFAAGSEQIHQIFEADGSVRGYGIVSQMDGYHQPLFCPGCELTIVFGGYTPVAGGSTGGNMLYTGGYVNIYVNDQPSTIDPGNPLTMNDGNVGLGALWLSLAGREYGGATLHGNVSSMTPPDFTGLGQLDVVGGVAARYFDSNAQVGGADMVFSTMFSQPYPGQPNHVVGTGMLWGLTSPVPEPATYLMLGTGMLALVALRRRKQH